MATVINVIGAIWYGTWLVVAICTFTYYITYLKLIKPIFKFFRN